MAMPVMVPAARAGPIRLQLDIGDAGRDVQPGLTLHADRLQRVGILWAADQKVATTADAHRGVGTDPTIIAGEIAASEPAARRVDRPGKPGLFGDAEIEAETADGGDIGI